MTHRITTVDRSGRPTMATLNEDGAARLWVALTGTACDRRRLMFASWTVRRPDGQWVLVQKHAAP